MLARLAAVLVRDEPAKTRAWWHDVEPEPATRCSLLEPSAPEKGCGEPRFLDTVD